jgi:hypothetical protein
MAFPTYVTYFETHTEGSFLLSLEEHLGFDLQSLQISVDGVFHVSTGIIDQMWGMLWP